MVGTVVAPPRLTVAQAEIRGAVDDSHPLAQRRADLG